MQEDGIQEEQNCSPSQCGSCSDASCASRKDSPEELELKNRLSRIKHKILVLSGKGGVGKSTVAVNLAMSLSLAGKRVGLLDADMHGPSVATMLRSPQPLTITEQNVLVPAQIGGLKVVSIGYLMPEDDRDEALIWRGPMKMGVIRQFLKDVEWGDLDYLMIDLPPGTGDEPLTLCHMIEDVDGAVVVTTPQEVAAADVRKSLNFCRKLDLPILGLVENMSGFVCPKCGEVTDIFKSGGGERMAKEFGVPFLGKIPIDPALGNAGDEGEAFVQRYSKSESAKVFEKMVSTITEHAKGE